MRQLTGIIILFLIASAVLSCKREPQPVQFYDMSCCPVIDEARYDSAYAQISTGKKKADDYFRGIHTGTTTGRGVVFSAHFDTAPGAGSIQIRILDSVSGKTVCSGEYDIGPGQKSLQSYYNFEREGRYTVQFLAGGSVIAQGHISLLGPEQGDPYR